MRSILAFCIAIFGFSVQADTLQPNIENGIQYLSGGVSDEEQAQLEAVSNEYNLKILMAIQEGNYLADVPVTISDASDTTILAAVSKGPFLYASLPPGTYTVSAIYEGDSKEDTVTVAADEQAQVEFFW